jgi:hypothetical protein
MYSHGKEIWPYCSTRSFKGMIHSIHEYLTLLSLTLAAAAFYSSPAAFILSTDLLLYNMLHTTFVTYLAVILHE